MPNSYVGHIAKTPTEHFKEDETTNSFTLYPYAYSVHCSLYISHAASKENLFSNQKLL